MAGRVTGDFGALARLRQGIQRLGVHGFNAIMMDASGRMSGLVERSFASGTDPYGNAWRPTLKGNLPLKGPTGELRAAATKVVAATPGLRVSIPLTYAGYHLTGTSRIPARPFLPPEDPSRLPPGWATALKTSAELVLRTWLR